MPEIRKTMAFTDWIAGLWDSTAVARIDVRIRRLSLRNAGDFKSEAKASLSSRLITVPATGSA